MITRRQLLLAGTALPLLPRVAGGASRPRVVIVGGGFGGATAARYLRGLAPLADVVIVEPNERFVTCPFSNLVIAGMRGMADITWRYDALEAAGIKVVRDTATAIDPVARQLRLSRDARLAYDFLVVSTGVELRFERIEGASREVEGVMPHAWKAGWQTELLAKQLREMKPGGVFLIAAPPNPYRCPPGPYERACLVAHWLERHNPRAKIIILDAKDTFTKQSLFEEAWAHLYPNMIDWVPVSETGALRRIDARRKAFHTDFDTFVADVGNFIPPQTASALLTDAGLDGGRGWCPIDPSTFESVMAENLFILGDATNASPMPKSAFSANNQAKVCAAAIAARIRDEPSPPAFMMNTCYSLAGPDYGISISGVYRVRDGELVSTSGGQSETGAETAVRKREAAYTMDWYRAITRDTFGPV